MFKSNRVYSTINTQTGRMSWYFQAREGNVGPFNSKPVAMLNLKDFVQNSMDKGNTGGREGEIPSSALQVQGFLKYGMKGM